MALSIATMASQMKDNIEQDFLSEFGDVLLDEERLRVFCFAVSRTIIPHFVGNAVVETDGTNAGGPLHGIGTITS